MAECGTLSGDLKSSHSFEKPFISVFQLYRQDRPSMAMSGAIIFALGATFMLTSMVYLISSKHQRKVILDRIRFQRRRASGANTPPRALMPPKEKASEFAPTPAFKDVFPPSRRGSLANITTIVPPLKRRVSGQTPKSTTSSTPLRRHAPIVGLSTPLEACSTPIFTPTEFSIEEIKALGDFPDYAELSGVPLPKPYLEFDIKQALPRPYRPFRWAYHQTMSLTKMETDWWLELVNTYSTCIADRKALFEKYGKWVLDYLPGSELACKELMEMSLQFLCARYPQYFLLSADKTIFHNGILNNTTDLKFTHPLHVLLGNVPEDFALMLRNPDDGFYYFRAGVICSSLGWNLGSKLGMQLHEIHAPIPDYKEKMQFSMDRYFSKMPTDRPIQRGSWGLEVDTPLFMPPGDPHEQYRKTQDPSLTLSRCNLRVDWQTLRRLPLSASIVFNFKALFTPIEAFRYEAYVPSICLKVLREGKESMMKYKNTWHVEHVVCPALEEMVQQQEKSGSIEKNWDVKTLEESPWFPGWEEKWWKEQGFSAAVAAAS